MNNIFSNTKGDRWIWLIVILLSVISLLAVYSAIGTLAYKRGVGAESILMKHLAMIVGGIALMYISHKIDYRYYRGISKLLMIITIPLLLYTLLFGNHVNDASRWIAIPGTGLKFPNFRFGQDCANYLPGAHAYRLKQENIKGCKRIIYTYYGRGLRRVYIDCAGQPFYRANVVRGKYLIANYWPYQYQTNSGCVPSRRLCCWQVWYF